MPSVYRWSRYYARRIRVAAVGSLAHRRGCESCDSVSHRVGTQEPGRAGKLRGFRWMRKHCSLSPSGTHQGTGVQRNRGQIRHTLIQYKVQTWKHKDHCTDHSSDKIKSTSRERHIIHGLMRCADSRHHQQNGLDHWKFGSRFACKRVLIPSNESLSST
jgi:hypothetical protein